MKNSIFIMSFQNKQIMKMLIKSILNRIEKQKSFVYEKVSFKNDEIEVEITNRKNSKPICSKCNKKSGSYDRLPIRRFSYVPLWGIAVVFLYSMRRVNCKNCGIVVESVPWSNGKSKNTRSFSLFLATWAKRLSWNEVAIIFGTSWRSVFHAVKFVVDFGLENRDISGATAIGVDEVQYGKGHQYITLVYQINHGARRLLYIGKGRSIKSLLRFFYECGPEWCLNVKHVCSDMWKPYLKVIKKKLKKATHILDRFHIVAHLNKKLSEIRASEAKKLSQGGYEDILKHTKYCFLKKTENLTDKQKVKLSDVLQYNLKSVRAYLLKESFQLFWNYTSSYWAEWYLNRWCARAMRSKLDPIKDFVGMIRRHQPLIINWFKAKKAFSSGVVEGLNRKVNLITRKSYGFRNYENLKIALYHTMGDLPEPEVTHKF